MTRWPCQYCSFNYYCQGNPVNSAFITTAYRVSPSITVETVVLTGSPCQYCINKHCWQGHPVNSGHLCMIDRVTLSTIQQNMLLTGWITTNQELRNATNQSLSYIGFTLSAVYMGCVIDRVTLSAVGVDVLLAGWRCQQSVLISYWIVQAICDKIWPNPKQIAKVINDKPNESLYPLL